MRRLPVSPQPRQLRPSWRCRAIVMAAAVVLSLPMGCASLGTLRRSDPIGLRTACTLPKTPTIDDVIAHLNDNASKIDGWRANSVRIDTPASPIKLSGNLVVQRDRRLRLEVTSPMGKEVDFGSNDEQFWIWTRPRGQPPAIYYAAHQDMDIARQHLPMPFEPEWLMEAMGVVPLTKEGCRMETEPSMAALRLISDHQMGDGSSIRKIIVVHACKGYVMAHSTYDESGKLLVRAQLHDYRVDRATGAVLPHHIKLDWPQAEMSLAMDLGHVEVNPPAIPAAVWTMPQLPGTALVNLGDPRLGGQQYASRRPEPAARQNRPAPETQTVPRSPNKPSVIASSAETLDPSLIPLPTADEVEAPEFEPPAVILQQPTFEPPVVDEPPGRASVDLLPESEPF